MNDESAAPRTALLAGATGLVGRALLRLLLASDRYRRVHVLLRRAAPGIDAGPKLKVRIVDFARLAAAPPRADAAFIALGTTIKADPDVERDASARACLGRSTAVTGASLTMS